MPRLKGQNQAIISVYRDDIRIFTGTKSEVMKLFKLCQSTLDRHIRLKGIFKGLNFERVGESKYSKHDIEQGILKEKTVKERYTTSGGVKMILTHDKSGKLLHTTFLK